MPLRFIVVLGITSRDLRWRFRLRKSCVRGQSRRAEPERKSRLVRGEARRDFPLTIICKQTHLKN